ncbi:MAG TPA: hypothetical protein VK929_02340 [Longimicrobiales bacterium]|nr:hypothetical protein [Longimicrobiales bacterium]
MSGRNALPLLLRSAAVLIALAAAWDPVVTSSRRSDAVVAVAAATPADSALARRVAGDLEGSFTVVRGAYAGADASVIAGGMTTDARVTLAGVPFAVLPAAQPVELLAVHAPASAPLDAVTPVLAVFRAADAAGAEFVLLRDGAVLDRTTAEAADASHGSGARTAALSFVPAQTGAAALRVEARYRGRTVAVQDVVVDVRDDRWRVHFHDGRPSWLSTFVRRTVEQDSRFIADARVVTSRDVVTRFGAPPTAVRDAASLVPFDVVVIGAPETLTAAEAAGLETYMRRRGGSVVLLLDRHADGPHLRLTGAGTWATADAAPVDLRDAAGEPALRAAARAWPVALPPGATALLRDGDGRAIVWRRAMGAGTLIVSGALDAWRYREADASRFEAFWPALLAEAAAVAPPPLIAEAGVVAGPGQWARVDVQVRDAALAGADARDVFAEVSAALQSREQSVPLLAVGPPGALAALFRAPPEAGVHMLRVVSDDGAADVPVVVRNDPASAGMPGPELVAMWVRSRGGAVVDEGRTGGLGALVAEAVAAATAPRQWHPMRSPWWLLPFVAALAGEWWWRRRRGLP